VNKPEITPPASFDGSRIEKVQLGPFLNLDWSDIALRSWGNDDAAHMLMQCIAKTIASQHSLPDSSKEAITVTVDTQLISDNTIKVIKKLNGLLML